MTTRSTGDPPPDLTPPAPPRPPPAELSEAECVAMAHRILDMMLARAAGPRGSVAPATADGKRAIAIVNR